MKLTKETSYCPVGLMFDVTVYTLTIGPFTFRWRW